ALQDADGVLKTFNAVLAIARLQAAGQAPDQTTFDSSELAADMASIPVETLSFYKSLIDEGFERSFRKGLEIEHERSSAHNRKVTPGAVEARRAQIQARGRTQ
ncbi:MAG: hypothetical protein B7Y78_12955, partial [Caulobacter sp. 35-67-4]